MAPGRVVVLMVAGVVAFAVSPLQATITAHDARINSMFLARCAGGFASGVQGPCDVARSQPPDQASLFFPSAHTWPDTAGIAGFPLGPQPLPAIGLTHVFAYPTIVRPVFVDPNPIGESTYAGIVATAGRNVLNLPAMWIPVGYLAQKRGRPPFPANSGRAFFQQNFSIDYVLSGTGLPPTTLVSQFRVLAILADAISYGRFNWELRAWTVPFVNGPPSAFLGGIHIGRDFPPPGPAVVGPVTLVEALPLPAIPLGVYALRLTGRLRLEVDPATIFFRDLNPPPVPDHFQCLEVKPRAAPARRVDLRDALGAATDVALARPQRLCAPVSKNGEDPDAPVRPEHLVGYRVRRPFTPLRGVEVVNELGALTLDLRRPSRLLVPASKSLSPPPPAPLDPVGIDHFQCYDARVAHGAPRFVPVRGVPTLDQFGATTVDLVRPVALCLPVDKNGETPDAPDHPQALLCYRTRSAVPLATWRAFTTDQLGSTELELTRRQELCLPTVVLL